MHPLFSLKGQTALVTGAGSADGIGFAAAKLLAEMGAEVAITATGQRIHQRVVELQEAGHVARGYTADLTAAQQPPINWGDATSLDRFLALITAERYRGYASCTPPAELPTRLIAFAQLIMAQYGWVGVILGAAGIYYALTSPNKNWRWLAITLALYLFFALTYSTNDSVLYLIPVWMFGAWAIARGLLAVMRCAPRFTRHTAVVLLLAFLFGPVLNVLIHFPAMNLRNDHAATEYANAVLAAAPPNAVVVTRFSADLLLFRRDALL